jgi:hypothetical protein
VNVTPDVIRDLWSLLASGDASADTRRLVDDYLAGDSNLARELRGQFPTLDAAPSLDLPPDHEARTLGMMKRRLGRRSPLRILALGFTGLTVARLVEQTTFNRSPLEVILLALTATLMWAAHAWHTRRLQHKAVFLRRR